jgi:uncharacterized protein (DUF433 family)
LSVGSAPEFRSDELLEGHPYLEREDIMQALRYAAWLAQEREINLEPAASGSRST